MENSEQDAAIPQVWKKYLGVGIQFLLIFYVQTFVASLYVLYYGHRTQLTDILIGCIYIIILLIAIWRLIKKLPMVAIMLASPTLPLCMMLLVLSLLPILQSIEKQLDSIGISANIELIPSFAKEAEAQQ